MNSKLDKKSVCVLTITFILLISFLVNGYQSFVNRAYRKEIGNEIYKSIEEIRTRNESMLLILDGCISSKSITKEEILSLYKGYTLINIAELDLWEKYLLKSESTLANHNDKVNVSESSQNEVFANIDEFVYSILIEYISDGHESIVLEGDIYESFYVMRSISDDLNGFISNFMEEKLSGLEGEEKSKKMINKGYWIDILKGIEDINGKYNEYMFKL